MIKYGIILLMLCLWQSKNADAMPPMKYLGIEQGLSNNMVTCITQDSYGFMWMGTYDGLDRYDGSQFKIFRNLWGAENSLVNNHVKAITAVNNKIFVGTRGGLMYYDYSDSRFHALYYLPAESHRAVKLRSVVNQIVADHTGAIYVTTDDLGLLKFEKSDSIGRQLNYHNKRLPVQAIAIDKANRVWLFMNGIGLCRYDSQKITLINNTISSANCLLSDQHSRIWIGTNNGLYTYTPDSRLLLKFDETRAKLSSENIFSLSLTQRQEIWVATNGDGINIWNERTGKLTYLKAGETARSLRSGAVKAVYEDGEKRKWIATLRGGVNIIDDHIMPFHVFTHNALNKNSVVNNFILSFCEDENHDIWIGTDGGGMSHWDSRKNTFTSYVHQPGPGSLSSNFVVSMVNDYTHKLWVATFGGGIDAMDKATGHFKHYTCYNPGLKAEEKNLWKLYEDHQRHLWASATWNGALYLLNRARDQFELFDKRLINLHALCQDQDGILWAGDYTRLVKIDIDRKNYRYFYLGQPIRAILADDKHHLWLGTEGGGLVWYNTRTNTYKRYTEADGLPNNSVLNILADGQHNLWCSTYNGLSKFNTTTGRFTNYFAADGLQSNQFNYNAALKLNNGQMLFGGLEGFTLFHPDSIKSYVHDPTLQLTGIKVNNRAVDGNMAYSHIGPVYDLKKITIPFSEATVTVNYTALEYSFPDKITYAYYLEGWDHNWNYVGTLKTAYYTRLNEGHYILKIKATNTAGVWSSKPLVVLLTVLPPWYRTWWAYLFYLGAFCAITYRFWLYSIKQTRLQYEVRIAGLTVEREKEINEKKLAFFTNISHEFRTPLTLIINPLKDLLNQSEENKEELTLVYRNAKRLIGMVDHLLLFRKAESENMVLHLAGFNFTELCKDVYTCFTHQAKIKQITYVFDSENSALILYVDREKIETALFNLIANALKFTPAGGTVQVHIKEDTGRVYVEIADTGIGIDADVGEKLFDKFYQVKDTGSLKTGFGIGLNLVKTFIESHEGSITYQSRTGGGATFILSLPKNHDKHPQLSVETGNERSSYLIEQLPFEGDSTVLSGQITGLELLLSDHQSILVIDDNAEIRNYIKKIFAAEYTVLEAGDGQLGLDIIKKQLPDVVISDIVMPNLSGLELCHILKQDSALSHIPIILLAGESTADTRLQGIEEGAVDFLTKPFDKDILVARVKGTIKNKRELQAYFYNEVTLKNGGQNISEEYKDFLYHCIAIIESSLMDPGLEVSMIAEKMGMSHSALYKKIKQMTGQSLNSFIRFIRLRKAAEIMIHTNCNVNEAAFRVGFNDIKYFRVHFYKQFGLNPSEFIKRHRSAFQKSYKYT